MRRKAKIRVASAALASLMTATQIAMPFPALADDDYVYCVAALSWAEYWENEGVSLSEDAAGDWEAASTSVDTRGESDLGAYDAVTRATSNHGLHRGSYQCTVKVYDTDGNSYDYTGKGQGESVDVTKNDAGTTVITVDGEEKGTYDHSMILGPKYVPVAVPSSVYDDFKTKYSVLENGDSMVSGYTENNLNAINETVEVSADTDGLKTVTQEEDGTYSFSKRAESTTGKTVDGDAIEISDVQYNSGYGDFLRVDIEGDYGDLGAHMYAVRWDYYGDQDTVLASYGTKFAADNWMHKSMGIQLGLTKSLRCELPEGYESGKGRWDVTVYATGYQDYTFTIQAEPTEYVYGTMDIPYADYYYGELGNETNTTDGEISYTADLAGDANMRAEGTYDAVTSATSSKWTIQSGTYTSEADENGSGQILGVSGVQVAIEKSLYESLTTAKEAGETSGVLGTLFDSFTLNEDQTEPAAYKELYADGTLSATVSQQAEVDLADVTATVDVDSAWGDYEIDMEGLDLGDDTVYGAVVTMTDGNQYGLLHLENIWRGGEELSWSVGVKTTEPHGNTLRYLPYENTNGATVSEVTYLTNSGIYSVHIADGLYLAKKSTAAITAEETAVSAGLVNVTITDLPEDYGLNVAVEGLDSVAYADGKLTYDATTAKAGAYTIEVTDSNDVYAHLTTDLLLTTDSVPVTYNAETNQLTLTDGMTDADWTAYLNNLTTVTVGDTEYSASGRGAVTIVKEDGTIDFGAIKSFRGSVTEVFPEDGEYTIKLTADGYLTDYTFTVQATVPEYVYGTMNIPYADYYYGELGNATNTTNGEISYTADLAGDANMRAENTYDAVTSATSSKWTRQSGTYTSEADENGGGKILGVSGVAVAIDRDLYLTLLKNQSDSSVDTTGVLGTLFKSFTLSDDQSKPAAYKELYADGTLSATVSENGETVLSDVTATVDVDSVWGDYEIDMEGLDLGEDTVYGAIVTMEDGAKYGMLHLENIWRGGEELAWSVGVKTTEPHGNTLRYTPYVNTSGATVSSVTYLTNSGIYTVQSADGLYLAKKSTATITAEETAVSAGSVNVTITDLPEDYGLNVAVEGLNEVAYADGKLTYDATTAKAGEYTIEVTDSNNVYAHLTTDLLLTTESVPVVYNAETNQLTAAEGLEAADLTAYLNNLSTVTVNDTAYSASGRGAVTIIKEDGTVDFSAAKSTRTETTEIFPTAGEYTLKLTASGYLTDYTFTVTVPEKTIEKGDVDGDGTIAVQDAVLVLTYYAKQAAGQDVSEDETLKNIVNDSTIADVDDSKTIDVQDAVYILTYYAKKASGQDITWDSVIGQ